MNPVFAHLCTIDPMDPNLPKATVKTRCREEKSYKAADKVKILQGWLQGERVSTGILQD